MKKLNLKASVIKNLAPSQASLAQGGIWFTIVRVRNRMDRVQQKFKGKFHQEQNINNANQGDVINQNNNQVGNGNKES
ncbi:MAG: hypothetical protein MJE77_44490 [Proteobacteria bacterium]|nr:hypothetical protein [Pseudomonadota bacterium]